MHGLHPDWEGFSMEDAREFGMAKAEKAAIRTPAQVLMDLQVRTLVHIHPHAHPHTRHTDCPMYPLCLTPLGAHTSDMKLSVGGRVGCVVFYGGVAG
jgi:hypothetical protein